MSSNALALVDFNLILYVFKTLSIQPLRCYHFDSTVSQVSIKTMKSLTNDEHKNCKHLAKRYKTDNKHGTKNVEMFDKRSLQIAIKPGWCVEGLKTLFESDKNFLQQKQKISHKHSK